jgi:hypothetical protein
MYKTNKAMSDTLYSGDRAGSRDYFVLENTAATGYTVYRFLPDEQLFVGALQQSAG